MSSPLRNRLKELRVRRGLLQKDLAALAGVTRQTISGIESGEYAPSAAVALRLARALGVRVEDLFWFEEDLPEMALDPGDSRPRAGARVALARIAGRWVAQELRGEDAFQLSLTPADGVATEEGRGVRLLVHPEALPNTVRVMGCDPALSLWARAAERRNPGLRVQWLHRGSGAALEALLEGQVHAAGMHLVDPATGEFNAPHVQRLLQTGTVVLVNVGFWEEGLIVAAGNPKGLREPHDLARPDVRIVNREPGTGARQLLDMVLLRAGVDPARVSGYDVHVPSHVEVARAVASGRADAGIGVALAARAFGLDFVPWVTERYDLAVFKEYLDDPPVAALLDTLTHREVRTQLATLAGYDTRATGDLVAEIAGAAR